MSRIRKRDEREASGDAILGQRSWWRTFVALLVGLAGGRGDRDMGGNVRGLE